MIAHNRCEGDIRQLSADVGERWREKLAGPERVSIPIGNCVPDKGEDGLVTRVGLIQRYDLGGNRVMLGGVGAGISVTDELEAGSRSARGSEECAIRILAANDHAIV